MFGPEGCEQCETVGHAAKCRTFSQYWNRDEPLDRAQHGRGRTLSVEELVTHHIEKVLASHGGNVSAAARALGMDRRTLQRKLRKLRAVPQMTEAPEL